MLPFQGVKASASVVVSSLLYLYLERLTIWGYKHHFFVMVKIKKKFIVVKVYGQKYTVVKIFASFLQILITMQIYGIINYF